MVLVFSGLCTETISSLPKDILTNLYFIVLGKENTNRIIHSNS